MQYALIIEILGTIAFTISGAFSAIQKKLDWFGVLSLGFVTAIGGGTVRDVLIGNTPVSWMRNLTTPLVILSAGLLTIAFNKYLQKLKITLFIFDTLGLGLFTIAGIKKGLDLGLNPGICITLGTITGCVGGVIRDMLLNHIPVLFKNETLYATACIIGGVAYFAGLYLLPPQIAETTAIIVICVIRIMAVRFNWRLPSVQAL